MGNKYVNSNDFNDFKNSFDIMIGVFNHSVSSIREDSKQTKKHVERIGQGFSRLEVDLAVVKEKTKNNNWMIKWIFGIITVVVTAGVISAFIPV